MSDRPSPPLPANPAPEDAPAARGSDPRPLAELAILRDMASRLREGLYVTDAGGAFLDGNPALLAMLGLGSVDELATYSLHELVADAGTRRAALERLQQEGDAHEGEIELLRPDGQPCTALEIVVRRQDPVSGAVVHHGIMVDVTKRVELERQLRELSVRDPLTGCYNRRYLVELERRMTEQGVGVAEWGCVYLDVDGFRVINQRYGHSRGDEVLVRMSRFLLRQVRAEETVVRTGADDFVVVLADADARRTENVARRIQLAAMRSAPAPFSIGWASRRHGEPFERTMTRAEQELMRVHVVPRGPEHDRREE